MLSETLVHIIRDNYTEAKVRGKKSFLLERQQLYSLADLRAQSDILGFLADGSYGPELSKLQEASSPVEIEKAVLAGFARTVMNLISGARGNVHDFLLEYVHRFDANDLANLVVYKSEGRTWEEYDETRHPLGGPQERWLRKLYSTESLRELSTKLGDKTLQARISGLSLEEMPTQKAALVRDVVAGWGEEKFYSYVNKRLHGRDRGSCLPIVGATIDLLNLTIILRSKLIGVREAGTHLVPVYWKISRRTFDRLVSAGDIDETLDIASSLSYYRNLLSNLRQKYEETKSLSFIELDLRSFMISLSRRILLGFPYTVGIILAFLLLKENEARNLAAIVSGVSAGLKPERIRELVAV